MPCQLVYSYQQFEGQPHFPFQRYVGRSSWAFDPEEALRTVRTVVTVTLDMP